MSLLIFMLVSIGNVIEVVLRLAWPLCLPLFKQRALVEAMCVSMMRYLTCQ